MDALCTSRGVRKCIKRLKHEDSRSRRIYTRGLHQEALDFIDAAMREDRELTAPALQRRLKTQFNIDISISIINKERLHRLGWELKTTRYCQMVRQVNKEKRFSFCRDLLARGDDFNDVIFTDECTVRCERDLPKQFVKKGEPPVMRPKPKHPFSVHVWAGISKRGTTDIAIFTGIMDSTGYQTILKDYLKPFITAAFREGEQHRFWQDNDPKHMSKSTRVWMTEHKINHWPTPPESPDLNPIERIWAAMKRHIRGHVKPNNKEELTQGIRDYWENLDAATCTKYIGRIIKDAKLIVEREGGPAGH